MQFVRNTSSRRTVTSLIIKFGLFVVLILGTIIVLSKIDFPAPKKEIEKVITNENFKIIK